MFVIASCTGGPATTTPFVSVNAALAFEVHALSEYATKYALYVPALAGAVMLKVRT
jgi:hypothetical protein